MLITLLLLNDAMAGFAPRPAEPVKTTRAVTSEARMVNWLWERGIGLSIEMPKAERDALLSQATQVGTLRTDGGAYNRYRILAGELDGVQVGSGWIALHEGGKTQCSVTGFEIIVSESYQPGAEPWMEAAPCGLPMVVATLDCAENLDFAWMAVPAKNTVATVATPLTAGIFTAPAGTYAETLQHPTVQQLRAQAEAEAAAVEQPLKQEIWSQGYALNAQRVELIHGRFFTGEGLDGCGDEDVVRAWTAVVVDGQPMAPRETTNGSIYGLVDIEGDGRVETLEWIDWETRVLRGADGQTIYTDAIEWCICRC